jgi:enoyl-CoA hydratase
MREIGTGHARLAIDGYRADVLIDRPEKRNAMNRDVLADLARAFREADAAEEVRAITLLGRGPVFSAGMDLEMMRGRASDGDADGGESDTDRQSAGDALGELVEAIESTRAPTVVGIEGAAIAGAFELTLPADVRLLGRDANYGVVEVKLGTFPHGGATQRLPRLVGLAKAKEIVLTGEYVNPEEALACGLVAELCEPGTVGERTRAFADRLCENAPLGMANAKQALDAALDVPLQKGLELERAIGRELDSTHDYAEGFSARIEGREPEFRGE